MPMSKSKNRNLTPLTEEEQKPVLKRLLLDELTGVIVGCVFLFILFAAINFAPVENWNPPPLFRIISLSITGTCLLAICTRIIYGYARKYLNFKKGRYTYHYLDIKEYRLDRYQYEVLYYLNGRQFEYTTVYGATKIHVFDCGGDPLALVDKSSCR